MEALSHHVVDGRQPEPVALGSIVAEVKASPASVFDGINQLRLRGWVVCTGAIHLDHDDRCLLLGEGLTRAAVMAAKRELALYEVAVDGRHYLVVYEQHPRATSPPPHGRRGDRWTARAFQLEHSGSASVMEADGATREEARDALVNRLSGSGASQKSPENRLR